MGQGGGKGQTCWGALGKSPASQDQHVLDDREYVRNICAKYEGEVRLLRSECPMAGVCSWELRGGVLLEATSRNPRNHGF